VINYNYSSLLPITSTDNAYNCEYLVSGKLLPEMPEMHEFLKLIDINTIQEPF